MTPDPSAPALDAALPELLGTSPAMSELLALVRRVAPHASTVLVTGETGCGKELIARALHRLGPRAGRAFVPVNCAAIVETLFESELFGHVRGAFTGATEHRVGLVERAHGGMLLLDEIGELSPAMQAKLLRVLETGEVTRVGATDPRRFDVHVVAATNRDLAAEVSAGRFRADLYYRLNIVDVRVPALRERAEDVVPLAQAFVRRQRARFGRTIAGLEDERRFGAGRLALARQRARAAQHDRSRRDAGGGAAADVRATSAGTCRGRPRLLRRSRRRFAWCAVSTTSNARPSRRRWPTRGATRRKPRVLGISRRALYRRIEKFGLDAVARAA